jgi:hypothetical protein
MIPHLLFLSIVLCCSVHTDNTPSELKFTHDIIIDNESLLGVFITDITSTEQGYIAVAINDLAQIKVFSPAGIYVNTLGQRGRGPGDFLNLLSVEYRFGKLYALDAGIKGKINVFDLNGSHDSSIGFPVLMNTTVAYTRIISEKVLIVEYRPLVSNEVLTSSPVSSFYMVKSDDPNSKKRLFESPVREQFISRQESGFTVDTMPFGRANHVVELNGKIYHVWTGSEYI